MTLYYMKIENTVFSKNNCEFYSRSIVSGWIGIIKMDKEDANTFPEKKYVQKWVIGTHSILGIEWVIAEETVWKLHLWCGRKGLI